MSCVLSKSNFIGASFTFMCNNNPVSTDQNLSAFITIIDYLHFGSVHKPIYCFGGYVPLTGTGSVLLSFAFNIFFFKSEFVCKFWYYGIFIFVKDISYPGGLSNDWFCFWIVQALPCEICLCNFPLSLSFSNILCIRSIACQALQYFICFISIEHCAG